MSTLGCVPEIIEVKNTFSSLESEGLIKQWCIPYENILTRRSAAIFFFSPVEQEYMPIICKALNQYEFFSCKKNLQSSLSSLEYIVEFKDNAVE